MIELFIDGQAVDIAPDTKITLNFESNLFGDISKITASNSFTIALPKTAKNNRIFAMPSVVGGMSNAAYRKWGAQLFVNGVSVVDTAYAMMLSVGDSYEIALYWGVITALSNLKESGKSLKELSEVLEITYGGANWWQDWETKADASGNLVNALYECGIEDLPNNTSARDSVALLPSVRGSWIWDNIVVDNALTIHTPREFDSWLKHIAVPFVGHKYEDAVHIDYNPTKYNCVTKGRDAVISFFGGEAVELHPFVAKDKVFSVRVDNRTFEKSTACIIAEANSLIVGKAEVSFDTGWAINSASLCFEHYSDGELVDTIKAEEKHTTSKRTMSLSFDKELQAGDYVLFYIRLYRQTGYERGFGESLQFSKIDISYKCSTEGEIDQVMGGIINTTYNLPDIKQIDFVKATMAMQGLWATHIDGEVHLQSVADFYNDAYPTLDWSHKLIGSGDGDAKKTTYTLANYVQRNTLRYKEDDMVKVDASGTLFVENDNLDQTKDMLTLPFSASDGNSIPHLSLEDGKVKEQKVQPRIMLLSEVNTSGELHASLDFDKYTSQDGEEMPSLRFSRLLSAYYGDWQRVIRNPIVIEEQMNLTEIDIKELDYRKPIYLQKYGARFAVQKVQWSEGDASVVTLVYLPPKEDIAVALPFSVKTGVVESWGHNIAPEYAHLVSGAGDYFGNVAQLSFNESESSKFNIEFIHWEDDAGVVLSSDNPFIYDGKNGDMTIYAYVMNTI